jgi:hypothetical protein
MLVVGAGYKRTLPAAEKTCAEFVIQRMRSSTPASFDKLADAQAVVSI